MLKPGGVLVITTPNMNSMYGINRKLYEGALRILPSRYKSYHPYDEWKRPKELMKILLRHKFVIDECQGACFLPGFSFGSRYLPIIFKNLIIKFTSMIEPSLKDKAANWGYMFGIRGISIT